MTEPTQERLDELGQKIDEVTRQAEEHGTVDSEPEPTIVDPDADGQAEGTGAPPP